MSPISHRSKLSVGDIRPVAWLTVRRRDFGPSVAQWRVKGDDGVDPSGSPTLRFPQTIWKERSRIQAQTRRIDLRSCPPDGKNLARSEVAEIAIAVTY